ncbi:BCL6A transcription repressor a isoform X1 [Lates japonicus]|uniref:BCL6A transcription repressor a isoform X1 n=1 Tax=Lates japonicus TaxID=270547 RepID=A0AAD3NHN0_LATJO|nr:BCL6A transcription repressor a isoform X1 [Lates japonicus]
MAFGNVAATKTSPRPGKWYGLGLTRRIELVRFLELSLEVVMQEVCGSATVGCFYTIFTGPRNLIAISLDPKDVHGYRSHDVVDSLHSRQSSFRDGGPTVRYVQWGQHPSNYHLYGQFPMPDSFLSAS